jgi:hypothetical protein
MEAHISQSLARAQRAVDIAGELFQLCYQHASSEDPALLVEAGILVGEFANNLRSALNFTSRVILDREVLQKVTATRRKNIRRSLDFPWATSKKEFDNKPICRSMQTVAQRLYSTLLQFQPFNPGYEWLGHLMVLSNRDKHVVTNAVLAPTATAFLAVLPDGTQLKEPPFVGDKLVIFGDKGPVTASLPHYYAPMKAFATPRKTWSIYLVPLLPRFSLDLIDYTSTSPLKVTRILAVLDARFDAKAAAAEAAP